MSACLCSIVPFAGSRSEEVRKWRSEVVQVKRWEQSPRRRQRSKDVLIAKTYCLEANCFEFILVAAQIP